MISIIVISIIIVIFVLLVMMIVHNMFPSMITIILSISITMMSTTSISEKREVLLRGSALRHVSILSDNCLSSAHLCSGSLMVC